MSIDGVQSGPLSLTVKRTWPARAGCVDSATSSRTWPRSVNFKPLVM